MPPASAHLDGFDNVWFPYGQLKSTGRPPVAVSTEGVRIRLDDGRTLIDGVGSWWTAVHGYNHPHLIEAVRRQLEAMPHVMLGGIVHDPVLRLADRLAQMTPGSLTRTFFSESGSVAVEVAMKIAVQYWRNKFGEKRTKFISFTGGYHGDTFATMSICDPDKGMHSLFKGSLAEQHVVDLPYDDASAEKIADLARRETDIAAIIVEPLIQGAAGMHMYDAAPLKRLRKICDETGLLLIFDEIFTGFARTGAMFAADKTGVTPDIMTLGKALTGGVCPLAATIASAEIYDAFDNDDPNKALMHGPTYTGHALGCAAANASLDLFESEPRIAQVQAIEVQMREAFQPLLNLPNVVDVRVTGAVGAVEVSDAFDRDEMREKFIADGLFVRPIGRVMYLTPPYVISSDDLRALTDGVEKQIRAL